MSVLEKEKNAAVITTNIPAIANLANGDVYQQYQQSKKKKKKVAKGSGNPKGRPQLHPFAGRITFRRTEVEQALQDGPAFIEKMQQAHALDEERRAVLMADGVVSNFIEMFYTYQGPIAMVLQEMQAVINRYQDKASVRCDFKKVNTYTDKNHEHYVPPTIDTSSGISKVTQVEAIPDRIYGYARIIMSNDEGGHQ